MSLIHIRISSYCSLVPHFYFAFSSLIFCYLHLNPPHLSIETYLVFFSLPFSLLLTSHSLFIFFSLRLVSLSPSPFFFSPLITPLFSSLFSSPTFFSPLFSSLLYSFSPTLQTPLVEARTSQEERPLASST